MFTLARYERPRRRSRLKYAPAMAIVPDDKDWTWVLDRRCPECGFVSSELAREQITPATLHNARQWAGILTADPERLRHRPRPDRWSVLEYSCHVRDVFRVMDERLNLMLALDNPSFQNWDQDRTALEDHYEAQDPKQVAAELTAAADALAGGFAGVEGPAWQRPGIRSNGARFTVETLGRYMIHDVVHHLHDVAGDDVAR
jgi:hypothetical protein